jgi:ribonuclease HII
MAILGIDEVGRGSWAGPLVVGAVVLGEVEVEGLTDSKKLSAARREALSREILERASGVALGWVMADELDDVGLAGALCLATRRATKEIRCPYHEIIIDGTMNFLSETALADYVTTLKKADALVPAVSAASVVAKVARDAYMRGLADRYPRYGFESHVGYGTRAHRRAIADYGVMCEHRRSFAPMREIKGKDTTALGHVAEEKVARALESSGHDILWRNWRTRLCEIDVVSRLGDTIYFTEVRYRRDVGRGSGLDSVTGAKLRRMVFAAEVFGQLNPQYRDFHLLLQVASVSGAGYDIDDLTVIDG